MAGSDWSTWNSNQVSLRGWPESGRELKTEPLVSLVERKPHEVPFWAAIGCCQERPTGPLRVRKPGWGGGSRTASRSRKSALESQRTGKAAISGLMAAPEGSGSEGLGRGVEKPVTYYRLSEVAKRNSTKEIWLVIHGRVYDVTPFLNEVGPGRWWVGAAGGRAEKRGAGRRACDARRGLGRPAPRHVPSPGGQKWGAHEIAHLTVFLLTPPPDPVLQGSAYFSGGGIGGPHPLTPLAPPLKG